MRTTTWNNIGTDVSTVTNIQSVLEKAKLNYEVVKQPIYTNFNGEEVLINDRVATVNKNTGEVLGIVSPKYQICQNEEAFDFVNNVDGVEFIKAGQTHTGMVYVIGKLNEMEVLGDKFTPYLIFQNGHNGNYTMKTTICPLRIVCQNQFNYAFKESPNTISIHHSSQYQGRLVEAQRLIQGTVEYMNNFKNTAEELATLKIGKDDDVKNIINAFFTVKTNATDRQIVTAEEARTELFNTYMAEDNANFTGTAWGLVNGFSDYLTHKETKNTKTKDESKFMTVTFDPKMFMAFVNHVKQFAY